MFSVEHLKAVVSIPRNGDSFPSRALVSSPTTQAPHVPPEMREKVVWLHPSHQLSFQNYLYIHSDTLLGTPLSLLC